MERALPLRGKADAYNGVIVPASEIYGTEASFEKKLAGVSFAWKLTHNQIQWIIGKEKEEKGFG